ncbi:GFA family protein [Polaromonas sp. YR568]|uniref:GFA family protein n=1 Tax=Polaromonas sp. YR568 TaxID=1855301 RepID=UPI00398C143B
MQVHGSCHCGGIRYEATVDPDHTTICHCTDCQKLTGSAYRVSVPAVEGSFQLLAGEPRIYVKTGDNGARRAQAFCPDCGSPLYTYAVDDPGIYGLRVGCIAEREALVPRLQKWRRSALRWTENLAGMAQREKS